MEDPRSEPDPRPLVRARARRWWPGPRAGRWPDAVQMAVPVAAAALLTVCGVGLALLLDSRGAGWEAPAVVGVGVVTVLFYGWAIYSAVHPLPAVPPTLPADAGDATEPGQPRANEPG